MRKLLVSAVATLTFFALSVGPLHAITFGELDGNDHANVGSIVVHVPGVGSIQFCSGTLVEPSTAIANQGKATFLTAAHCTAALTEFGIPAEWITVTFDSTIDPSGTFYAGTMMNNPSWTWASGQGGKSDPHDVSVIVLDDDPGIAPARLPEAGLLDRLQAEKVLKDTRFTAVGYGVVRETMSGGLAAIDPTNLDRRRVEQGFNSLTKAWLNLPMVNTPGNENGGTCNGDSGGPHFIHLNGEETDIVVSVTSTGDRYCKATDTTYRVDTESARSFLAPYVDLP